MQDYNFSGAIYRNIEALDCLAAIVDATDGPLSIERVNGFAQLCRLVRDDLSRACEDAEKRAN